MARTLDSPRNSDALTRRRLTLPLRYGTLRVLGLLGLALLSCRTIPETRTPQTTDKELAAGIVAHEKGNFHAALPHAQKAVALAPKMIEAHLLLARIADDMCVPNLQPQPDERSCRLAVQEYKTVLDLDASHLDALKNLAYLLYQFNRLGESESYYRRSLSVRADDPDGLCGVAAIDFRRAFPEVMAEKARLNLKFDAPMIQLPSCTAMRDKHQARVDEGIALVLKALRIGSDDPNLIGYLSALYQLRAEIQCGNKRAYQMDRNAARMWGLSGKQARTNDVPADFLQKCPAAPPPPPDL